MNKRDKKRLEVLKKLKQRFQLQISGAKKQEVEVDEVASLERELAKIDEEITKLKSA
jgi:energy-coupling factor transporter ATP-binding protein EcfA2